MSEPERNIASKSKDFFVKNEDGTRGPLLSEAYTRLVVGDRGPYVEFLMVNQDEIELEPGQEYRVSEPWINTVYYIWYRTKIGHRKLYVQLKTVKYADYLIGMVYVAPDDLMYEGELYTERLVKKQRARTKKEVYKVADSKIK